MSCDSHAPLISGLLDGELGPEEEVRIRTHLASCGRCALELDELRLQREITSAYRLQEPSPEAWDRFSLGVYQRIERAAGWVLLSIGLVLGGSVLVFQAFQGLITDPTVPMIVRLGIPVAAIGLVILLISVAREKLFLHRTERYREIIR